MRKQNHQNSSSNQGVRAGCSCDSLTLQTLQPTFEPLKALLWVFGQQNRLILKHREFKGAKGPLSNYVCPPTVSEKEHSEHGAPASSGPGGPCRPVANLGK